MDYISHQALQRLKLSPNAPLTNTSHLYVVNSNKTTWLGLEEQFVSRPELQYAGHQRASRRRRHNSHIYGCIQRLTNT